MSKKREYSLYVGDLDQSVTESDLMHKFSKFGPIYSTHICVDSKTKRSLGYGYVNLAQYEHAEEAIANLNSTLIRGKPCRVMWSQRDPSFRNNGEGNIIVLNLDQSISQDQLSKMFSTYGRVISCKIPLDSRGNRKSYGYVQYQITSDAFIAIEKTDGTLLAGKKISVEAYKQDKGRREKSNEVEISGLPHSWREDDVYHLIEKYGTVSSIDIKRDNDGNSIGCIKCTFVDHDIADIVINDLDGIIINSSRIQIQKVFNPKRNFKPKSDKPSIGYNCKVKNLELEITTDKLSEFFSQFGTITSCTVIRDCNNISKGYGYVCFENEEQGEQAIMSMNGRSMLANPLLITPGPRYNHQSNPAPPCLVRTEHCPPINQSPQFLPDCSNSNYPENRTCMNRSNLKLPSEVEKSFKSHKSMKNNAINKIYNIQSVRSAQKSKICSKFD